MSSTLYIHDIASVTVKPAEYLQQAGCWTRTIVLRDTDDKAFEVTMFGTESGLGIIEEHAE